MRSNDLRRDGVERTQHNVKKQLQIYQEEYRASRLFDLYQYGKPNTENLQQLSCQLGIERSLVQQIDQEVDQIFHQDREEYQRQLWFHLRQIDHITEVELRSLQTAKGFSLQVVRQFRLEEKQRFESDKQKYQKKLAEILERDPLVNASRHQELKQLQQEAGFSDRIATQLEDEYHYREVFQEVIRNYDLSQTSQLHLTTIDRETIQHYRKKLAPPLIQSIESRAIASYREALHEYSARFQEALQHLPGSMQVSDRMALKHLKSQHKLKLEVVTALEARLTNVHHAMQQQAITLAEQATTTSGTQAAITSSATILSSPAPRHRVSAPFIILPIMGAVAIGVGAIALIELIRLPDVPSSKLLKSTLSEVLPALTTQILEAIVDDATIRVGGTTSAKHLEVAQALRAAILQASFIPAKAPVSDQVKPLMVEWSKRMLQLAEDAYQRADLASAIQILQAIPEVAPNFSQAIKLRKDWETQQRLVEDARTALATGDRITARKKLEALQTTALRNTSVVSTLRRQVMPATASPGRSLSTRRFSNHPRQRPRTPPQRLTRPPQPRRRSPSSPQQPQPSAPYYYTPPPR